MLMRDDYAGDILGKFADTRQTALGFADSEATIEHHRRGGAARGRGNDECIAFAATA